MTEDEVDFIAAELAKAGGVSWYPGRERGPLKVISDRYRDRARLAIAALDRFRAGKLGTAPAESLDEHQHEPGLNETSRSGSDAALSIGSTVLYRPPGDKRLYPCRIEKIDGSRVHLVPDIPSCTGWVDLDNLSSTDLVSFPQPDQS